LAAAGWLMTRLPYGEFWPKAFYALAVAAGAWPLLRGAVKALLARSLDMNVLMSIAVVGACILGDWGEAAALVFLYAVSEWIEEASVRRSRTAIGGPDDPGTAACSCAPHGRCEYSKWCDACR
jgi:Cd2+/Zn2+-exporting ATPase